MAKKIAAYNTNSVVGAAIKAASAANLVQGVFVGIDGNGEIEVASFLSGAVVARGAMLQDAQMKDPKGNVLDTIRRGSYTFEGKIAGLTSLTPGATYYVGSGGGITATPPAATSGQRNQKVGYALSASELQIEIGTEAEI